MGRVLLINDSEKRLIQAPQPPLLCRADELIFIRHILPGWIDAEYHDYRIKYCLIRPTADISIVGLRALSWRSSPSSRGWSLTWSILIFIWTSFKYNIRVILSSVLYGKVSYDTYNTKHQTRSTLLHPRVWSTTMALLQIFPRQTELASCWFEHGKPDRKSNFIPCIRKWKSPHVWTDHSRPRIAWSSCWFQ